MTVSITTNAGNSIRPITRITKNEFILQGYDIVQAYARKYRVTATHLYNGASQLADFMWKRFADKNGTIPLLEEHTAVRLSNGRLRVITRISHSEQSTTGSMPVPTVDDSHPPIEPPELDEDHVLPKPFHRSEEPTAPRHFIPFPPAPEDPCSPQGLSFTNLEPLGPSNCPDAASPKLDFVYPPRGQPILGATGEQIGYENPHSRWIIELVEQVRQRRQKLLLLLDGTKADLSVAVLDLQHARNELDTSVTESQKTMNHLRSLFGTECALQVVNVKEEMKKRRAKSPVEVTRQSASSSYDYDNDNAEADSHPETWSSRDSPSINDRGIIEHDAPCINTIDHSKYTNSHGEMYGIPEIDAPSVNGGLSIEGIPPLSPRSQGSSLNSSLGKRAREEDQEQELDSETEVEASILYNDEPLEEPPKKIRLDKAGTSVRALTPRRSCLKRNHDMDVDGSGNKSTHRVRFPENPASSNNRSLRSRIKSESPSLQPKNVRKTSTPTSRRRPLVRSTSKIMETDDGGYYYLKYFPPNSKETSY